MLPLLPYQLACSSRTGRLQQQPTRATDAPPAENAATVATACSVAAPHLLDYVESTTLIDDN